MTKFLIATLVVTAMTATSCSRERDSEVVAMIDDVAIRVADLQAERDDSSRRAASS